MKNVLILYFMLLSILFTVQMAFRTATHIAATRRHRGGVQKTKVPNSRPRLQAPMNYYANNRPEVMTFCGIKYI